LVGYLTVNVVRETQGKAMGHLRSITDLQGQRVAVRPGSVSEALLQDLNAKATAAPVVIRRVFSLDVALERLERNQLDAVLADNLQLMDLVLRRPRGRLVPSLVLQGIHPESQAFAFGPDLPAASAERIDLAISTLKRSGVVSELREQMGLSDRSEP
jgi:ABC-type amino acid transport substrate-binding protein